VVIDATSDPVSGSLRLGAKPPNCHGSYSLHREHCVGERMLIGQPLPNQADRANVKRGVTTGHSVVQQASGTQASHHRLAFIMHAGVHLAVVLGVPGIYPLCKRFVS
jgi:hypothetical protein